MTVEQSEEWRAAVGFPAYEVSSHGRVRSVDRVTMGRRPSGLTPTRYKGKPMRVQIGSVGYPMVTLYAKKPVCVHVLVCEAFHGPRPAGYQVAHNDGSRDNNHAENLRWATPSENNLDKRDHGSLQDQRGERNPGSKLTEADVRLIRRIPLSVPHERVGVALGIPWRTVSHIRQWKSWNHIGHEARP